MSNVQQGDFGVVFFRACRSVCFGQVTGIHVGFPSRTPNRRLHPLSRGSTDFTFLVDHIRNCRGRNPSEVGDVFYRDSCVFLQPGSRCTYLQMAIVPTGRIHFRTSPVEDELSPLLPIGISLCGRLAITRIFGYLPKCLPWLLRHRFMREMLACGRRGGCRGDTRVTHA